MKSVKPILMIGAFPPPIHGMSLFNSRIHQLLERMGCGIHKVDTSPSNLSGNALVRIQRIFVIADGLVKLWRLRRQLNECCLYIGISGGWGQVYDILFIANCRLFGVDRIAVHHHSSAYLQKYRLTTQLLVRMAGKGAVHIVACKVMEKQLRALYERKMRVLSISGVITVENSVPQIREEAVPFTVGFLSNVSREKGILEFIGTLRELKRRGVSVRGLIAGPFMNQSIEEEVRAELRTLNCTQYVGPVYGDEKESFLRRLDVFLFPTFYENETEGLVIHEAMAHGVPVIASARACIPHLLSCDGGKVIGDHQNFSDVAASALERWIGNPLAYKMAKKGAIQRYQENYKASCEEFNLLFDFMTQAN